MEKKDFLAVIGITSIVVVAFLLIPNGKEYSVLPFDLGTSFKTYDLNGVTYFIQAKPSCSQTDKVKTCYVLFGMNGSEKTTASVSSTSIAKTLSLKMQNGTFYEVKPELYNETVKVCEIVEKNISINETKECIPDVDSKEDICTYELVNKTIAEEECHEELQQQLNLTFTKIKMDTMEMNKIYAYEFKDEPWAKGSFNLSLSTNTPSIGKVGTIEFDPDVSSCEVTLVGVAGTVHTLTTHLNCTNWGIRFGNSSLIFDGNGTVIEYGRINGINGVGINTTNYDNNTIKNCVLIQQNSSSSDYSTTAIHVTNCDNCTIFNNSVQGGINARRQYGINILGLTSAATHYNTNVSNNIAFGSYSGIYTGTSVSNIILSGTIIENNIVGYRPDLSTGALVIGGNVRNSIVKNTTINATKRYAQADGGIGIGVFSSGSSFLTMGNIIDGVYYYLNNISTSAALFYFDAGTGGVVYTNTIKNAIIDVNVSSATNQKSACMMIGFQAGDVRQNEFQNLTCNLNNASVYSNYIYYQRSFDRNDSYIKIANSSFSGLPSTSYHTNFTTGSVNGTRAWYWINTTTLWANSTFFDGAINYRTNVTQQWYVKVNVKWINGTAIEGARIWTLNQNGTSENGLMTDANGDSTNAFSEILYSDFFTANYTNTTIYADFEGMQNSTNVLVNTNLDAGTIYLTPSNVRCGEAVNTNIVLDSDMNCTGNATIINASNIIFDCNWHTIEYARILFGYGILSTNTENVTIKNCFITQQNASMGVNNADSIYLNNSDYTKIDNISTRIVGSNAIRSFYISSTSHWNRINNISIYQVPTPCIGIYVLSSGVLNATTNISNFNITMWGGTYALQTDAGTKNVKIENGTINMFGGSGGIYFIRSTTAYGSDGFSEIRNVSFFMNASGQSALILRENINGIFKNITITSTGATSLGLSFTIGGNYNHTFKNIHINMTQLGSTHINFDRINANLFFENVTFSGQSITQITKTTATYYSGNNTFLNPTGFNRSAMTYDTADVRNNLTLQWYGRVNVSDLTGTPINSAIVNSTNAQGIFQDLGTTGADGLTAQYIFNDTMYRGAVSNITYNDHTVMANTTGYYENSTNFTLIDATLDYKVFLAPISGDAPDLICSFRTGVYGFVFRPTFVNLGAATYTYPDNQTAPDGFLTCNNTGTAAGLIRLKLNDTWVGVSTVVSNDSFASEYNLTTTYQNLFYIPVGGSNKTLWFYRNYTSFNVERKPVAINITVVSP